MLYNLLYFLPLDIIFVVVEKKYNKHVEKIYSFSEETIHTLTIVQPFRRDSYHKKSTTVDTAFVIIWRYVQSLRKDNRHEKGRPPKTFWATK